MRKVYLALLLLVSGLLFTAASYAQITVTATGAGPGPTVYTTLKAAVDAVNAGTHTGAITLMVTANTTETVQAQLNSSGTGAASYTSLLIKPAPATTPTIAGAVASATALLKLNGADNVTIDGSNTVGGTTRDLTFNNTLGAGTTVVLWVASASAADGANNNIIKNCNLAGASPSIGTICLLAGSGSTLGGAALAPNNNNTFQNNACSNAQNGIYMFGYATLPYDANWTITGNTFSGHIFRGMIFQNASNMTISNNFINGIAGNLSAGATIVGIQFGSSFSGVNIVGNTIQNINMQGVSGNGCAGIWLNTTTATSNFNIYNNFINDVWATLGSAAATITNTNGFGILMSAGGGYNIYNNTIVSNTNQTTGFASGPIGIASGMTTASSVNIKNNILINKQTAGATNRASIMSSASNAIFASIDNNDYFTTSGILGYIAGTTRLNIAAMQAGFGGNLNSLNIDPTFVSAADLHLQNVVGNQLLQSGVAIGTPAITTDIDGNPRAAIPVMGAHEIHIPSVITYTTVTPSCVGSDITLAGVNITDAIGIPLAGANVPRVYFNKNGGAWASAAGTNTGGTATNSDWSFTMPAASVGGTVAGDVISYFVIAQNNVATVVSEPSAGLVASNVNTVTTPPTTPNSFTVSALPTVASLTTPTPATCEGTPFTLNAGAVTGVGALTSYNWSGPAAYSTTTAASSTSVIPATTASSGQYSLTVTYPGDGCTSDMKNVTVTVNGALPAIGGTPEVCVDAVRNFTNTSGGGTWSSSNTSVATINVSSGVARGIMDGTATITYKVGACITVTELTVNPLPLPITGAPSVCIAEMVTLANATAGVGAWSSNNAAIASVDAATGEVTGITNGATTISYTLATTGCAITKSFVVNPLPSVISGALTVCEGATTNFNSSPAGGVWSSSAPATATVDATGNVSGLLAGNAEITYTLGTGCIRTKVITVNPVPGAITPAAGTVCSGQTLPMSCLPPGGTWTSSSTPIANINTSTGIITGGSSAGTARISYTVSSGCRSVTVVTNNLTPAVIGGVTSICEGGTVSISNSTSGGVWSSSDIAVASITAGTGLVTGVGFGTTVISYTGSNGCVRTKVFTVYPTPATIGGIAEVCIGSTTTLSNTTTGGTWSSSTPSIANAGVSTGIITGMSAGNANITYKTLNGCLAVVQATVNALPATITGTANVCVGSTTALNSLTLGGTWSSSNPAVATGDAGGIITGIAAGTAELTYTLSTGCFRTKIVTVNPVPGAITGTLVLCPGTSTTLSTPVTPGTWTSSNTAVGTIHPSTGFVSAIAAGTSLISYRFATGCSTTAILTVNALPAAITGVSNVCVGGTTDLDNTDIGGTWTSGNALVASVDPTGLVGGLAAGTSWITYTMPSTCISRVLVTVNVTPTAITGTQVVCEGSTTNLMSTPGAGTWSTSNAAIASATAATGVIAGVSEGTVNVTYTVGGSGGCINTTVVTVNPLPQPITGVLSVCIGSVTALDNITIPGTWTSGNPIKATIGIDGVVTGYAAGTSTISYTLGTGCARVVIVTVNALPTAITGPAHVCEGSNITLNSAPATGTWSSSDVTIATIAPTKVVTGVLAGTTNISYILPSGCFRTLEVTVDALPDTIINPGPVCSGRTVAFTDATPGGTWSTASAAYASVVALTGIVTGGSNAGTTTISYTLSSGCRVTSVVTNNLSPTTAISGSSVICEGNSITVTNSTAGGSWSSFDPSVASIGASSGFVTGLNAGTTVITYTVPNGCFTTKMMTVNPIPGPITGTLEVCVGSATALSNGTPGGTWASGTVAIATINNLSGVANGLLAGTSNVTYKLSNSCINTAVLTVNGLPAITGASTVCVGSSSTLASTTLGGAWSSGNTAVATVDASGAVTGIVAGTVTIFYAAPGSGCTATKTITVNPLPASIVGANTVCPGATTVLTDVTTGGTWSTGNGFVATVSTTGVVTGVAAGVTDITYKLNTTCLVTQSMTVSPIPTPNTGATAVCAAGGVITLSNATAGGTWASSNTTAATVDGSGNVTGLASGNTTISYTVPSGCIATTLVTVQPVPSVISGLTTICSGTATNLSSFPNGGVWSSSTPAVATVSAFGVVAGISGGTSEITYALATGCNSTVVVSVNQTPGTSTGSTSVCLGGTGTLVNALAGGQWTSANSSVAIIGLTTGVITPVNQGAVNITYTMPSGCKNIINITVNGLPSGITGNAGVCEGSTTLLASATVGGSWTSSAPGTASVGSGSGVVIGVIPGTATISYISGSTSCATTRIVTVYSLPAAITGTLTACVGGTTTLSSLTAGGTWTSGSTANATIGATTGILTGVAAGTANITYKMGTGCQSVAVATVLPLPAPITGVGNVCVGGTTVYISTTSGGVWSSSNNFVALVGTNGVVTGSSPGTAIISYEMTSGCYAVKSVSVAPMPSPIAGTLKFCLGTTTNLSSLTPGGTWTSSNTLNATIGLTTGLVSGILPGLSTIVYTAPSGCIVSAQVTVDPLPLPISGNTNICQGGSSTLSSLTLGGAWSSGNPVRVTIDASTGVATGVTIGTAVITYLMPSGCRTTTTVTVSAVPATILGVPNVCMGSTTTLTNATSGGVWSSDDITIATISSSGVVTGINVGSTIISYTSASGCSRTFTMNVLSIPDPITGTSEVCIGSATTLASATTGGVWTSSIPSRATVHVTTGVVTGVNAGTSVITYALSGCQVFTVVTVHPLPAPILGITNICSGSSTTLTNAVSGGVWSNVDPLITSIVPATGEVTGINAGTDTIRYTLTGGCSTYKIVTVTAAPDAITGDFEICVGETSALSNTAPSGSWSSGNTSIVTVGLSSGIVTGIATGVANVTYTLGAGCMVFVPIQVNGMPAPITGPAEVCIGDTVTLANSIAGGTWTSNDISIAAVNDITGVVSGNSAGSTTINYELTGGCVVSFGLTVNPLPAPITGIDSVCQGLTTDLDNADAGGIWTSSAPSIAPINLVTGIVTGVAVGTSRISYTLLGTGCRAEMTVSVNPGAANITGTTHVCVGSSTVLANGTPGGLWSSSDMTVALVGSTTGLVQGLSSGSTTISYLLPTGCLATAIVVVNPLPDNIGGITEVCVGSTGIMTNITPFGIWSSSDATVATIGSTSGIATGIAAGTSTISYTLLATGCYQTQQILVNPLPPAITGVAEICLGSSTLLASPVSGGTWSSSDPGVATVSSVGDVTATGVGTSTITYMLGSACYRTRMVTVEPTLNPITGVANVCEFASIILANDYIGGVWSSSNDAVATVNTVGIVTGVAAGPVTISYATPLAGCYALAEMTVDPIPVAIEGTDSVCVGAITVLSNATPGGTWSSSDPTVASISAVGIVTGVSASTATIVYTIGAGCTNSLVVKVKPLADADTIAGPTSVCLGQVITLTDVAVGGVWSSSNPAVATVGASGVVGGIASGTAIISYIVTNDCSADTATYNMLVKPAPDAGTLAGTTGLCIDYVSTLTTTVAGGTWSSSNPAVASVTSAGVVTGISAGTATISYGVSSDCGTDYATLVVTVYTMAPHTGIKIHPDTVLCANTLFRNFGAEGPAAAGNSYIWTADNAEIYATSSGDKQNALISFHNPGIAIVRLVTQITSTGCYSVDSFVATINADSAFSPEVKYYASELICTDNTSDSYQWGYDDVETLDSTMIYGAFQQSYYLPVPDFTNRRYWVIAERGGCFQKVYYNQPTTVDPTDIGMIDVRLFPNPADARVNIVVRGLNNADDVSIRLIDMLGKELETSMLVNGKGSIDVARLPSGIYSVMFISNGTKIAAKTFVKN